MASEEIILRSPALDNAVKMFAVDSYPSRRPGKNSLNQMGGMVSFGSSVDEYNGPFKLQAVSPTKVEIVYGPNPSADFCGYSDIPGFYRVPKLDVTVDIATAGTYIYLYFDYNKENKKYSAHLDIGVVVPEDIILFKYIGGINQGKLYQSYKIDVQMKFSDDFYLTPSEDD